MLTKLPKNLYYYSIWVPYAVRQVFVFALASYKKGLLGPDELLEKILLEYNSKGKQEDGTHLKMKFKELDEVEEHNTFFELFMEKLMKDLKFHVINYDDFNTIDNQA